MFPFLIGTVRTLFSSHPSTDFARFPFLIGTVRTLEMRLYRLDTYLVSIPHRYGKNSVFPCVAVASSPRVSIPHRYGKNRDDRVGRRKGIVGVSIPHRYGKNVKVKEMPTQPPMFPFLIGTVRTIADLQSISICRTVSIPHRYGKNMSRSLKYRNTFKKVSIPHRYGKNWCCKSLRRARGDVSIPHRYGKNTCRMKKKSSTKQIVSIPHRYGKNIISYQKFGQRDYCFHSS